MVWMKIPEGVGLSGLQVSSPNKKENENINQRDLWPPRVIRTKSGEIDEELCGSLTDSVMITLLYDLIFLFFVLHSPFSCNLIFFLLPSLIYLVPLILLH